MKSWQRWPRWLRGALWCLFLLVVASGLLFIAGGGIQWEREAPYRQTASWGGQGSAEGEFHDPTGIAVTDTEVFVSDARNSRIQVFDKQGNFKRAFGQDALERPMNLEIARNRLYVPDYFQDVIHVFTLEGEYVQAIVAQDGLNSPGGVAVKPDGTLLVADTYGHRVVHLKLDGEVLRVWGSSGEPGRAAGTFRYPTDVALARDGSFYVADGYNHRVQQFSAEGDFTNRWGGVFGLGIPGKLKGWFFTASSVALGPEGQVLVADFFNQRVQKFTHDGRFLTAFGEAVESARPGAIAVAVDKEGRLFVASLGGNRVEVWAP